MTQRQIRHEPRSVLPRGPRRVNWSSLHNAVAAACGAKAQVVRTAGGDRPLGPWATRVARRASSQRPYFRCDWRFMAEPLGKCIVGWLIMRGMPRGCIDRFEVSHCARAGKPTALALESLRTAGIQMRYPVQKETFE